MEENIQYGESKEEETVQRVKCLQNKQGNNS